MCTLILRTLLKIWALQVLPKLFVVILTQWYIILWCYPKTKRYVTSMCMKIANPDSCAWFLNVYDK